GIVLYATGALSLSVGDFADVHGNVTVKLNNRASAFTGSIAAGGLSVDTGGIDPTGNVPDFSAANFGATVFGLQLGAPASGTSSAQRVNDITTETPVVKFARGTDSIQLVVLNLGASLSAGPVKVSATGGKLGIVLTDEAPGSVFTPGIVLYATGTLGINAGGLNAGGTIEI